MQLNISGLQVCDEKLIPTNLWISMWGVTPKNSFKPSLQILKQMWVYVIKEMQ